MSFLRPSAENRIMPEPPRIAIACATCVIYQPGRWSRGRREGLREAQHGLRRGIADSRRLGMIRFRPNGRGRLPAALAPSGKDPGIGSATRTTRRRWRSTWPAIRAAASRRRRSMANWSGVSLAGHDGRPRLPAPRRRRARNLQKHGIGRIWWRSVAMHCGRRGSRKSTLGEGGQRRGVEVCSARGTDSL